MDMRLAKHLLLPGLLLLGGCAGTCVDDGFGQDDPAGCPVAGAGSTGEQTSTGQVTLDPSSSTGTDPESCDNGVFDLGETDVDCGGVCSAGCAVGRGCEDPEDCESNMCSLEGRCAAGTPDCTNGAMDGTETDVDCGGPSCAPCGDGAACGGATDCESGVCDGEVCAAASCDDGVRNGSEADVDCGEGCEPCADGSTCTAPEECASGICDETCLSAACGDGVQNGGETDVDCGGDDCSGCDDGATCSEATDCSSGVCEGDVCVAPACDDEVRNGDETDVDCGGSCDPCSVDQSCVDGDDCGSGVCHEIDYVCLPAGCDDGVQNGGETGTDCGGECGPTCDPGEGCSEGSDCVSLLCDAGSSTCAAPTCDDGAPNGDETDVDCGGSCDPCPVPGNCLVPADCESGVCAEGSCAPPRCDDGVLNGTETGLDCGGSTCGPCGDGEACVLPTDCISSVCTADACVPATCMDGVQNQGETAVDCGGPNCNPCADGDACVVPSDCMSMVCDPVAQECEAASCEDEVLNGDETDTDCGGPECSPCPTDGACAEDEDCASAICDDATDQCAAPTCDDGEQNGNEADTDCGGDVCDPCGDGDSCVFAGDCASQVCLGGECQSALCDDGVLNGDETDTDCGGSCANCPEGGSCVDNGDCVTGVCDGASVCVAASCSDGLQNQDESDVDCGGSLCAACPDGGSCFQASDCDSAVCSSGTCAGPECFDATQNGTETDEDCGGDACPPCGADDACVLDSDCASGSCTGDVCDAPTCTDGILNGDETDVDCGGSTCAPCVSGGSCSAGTDCETSFCSEGVCGSPSCTTGGVTYTLSPDLVARFNVFGFTDGAMFQDAAGTVPVTLDGQDVFLLQDQGGGVDLLAPAADQRPTFLAVGPSGRPALDFANADDDTLERAGSGPAGEAFRLFIVLASTGGGSNASAFSVGPEGGGAFAGVAGSWQVSRDSATEFMTLRVGGGWDTVTMGTDDGDDIRFASTSWADFTDGELHSIYVNYDGTEASLFFDGILEAQGEPGAAGGMLSAFVRLFRNRNANTGATLNGQLAEFIFTEDDVNDAEADLITNYLNCRHGIE